MLMMNAFCMGYSFLDTRYSTSKALAHIHYVSMLRTNAHLFEFNSHSKHGNNKDHHLVRIQQCDLRKRIGSDSTVFLLCFDYYASDHKQLSQLTVKFG